jgi:hypothetical protein
MSTSSSMDCFRFLREMADHLDAKSGAVPTHAASCATCAERLRRAREAGDLLRVRPEVPAELRAPAFFESILEATIEDAAATTVGRALAEKVRIPRAVEAADLTITTPDSAVLRELQQAKAAPAWLWQQTRAQVAIELRASGRRRFAQRATVFGSAAAACLAIMSWFWLSHGTKEPFDVVFVSMSEMPALEHPTAVLRKGINR